MVAARLQRGVLIALALTGVVAGVVVAAALLASPGGATTSLRTTVVQSGLEIPWAIAFHPDGRMLVTERPGHIRVYASADPGAALLQAVEIPDVRAEGEAGVMGIVVDRDPAAHPFAYVCASRDADGQEPAPWRNELLRYRIGGEGLAFDSVLFAEPMEAAVHHNGCALAMDEARLLWMTMGDGNIPAATVNPAQDPTRMNGKILRLTADGGVPDDNPKLPGAAGPSAVYSMGHRNPQGIAFGPDGLILAAEHGTTRDDEVNRIVPGGNYGWACYIGGGVRAQAFDGSAGAGCVAASAYLPPLWSSGATTLATSGAAILAGKGWRDWAGSLVVTTLKEEDLRRFHILDGGERLEAAEVLFDGEFGRLRAAILGPDASLYLSTSNGGGADLILRVERS